jgi:hypothetical protein
MQKIMESIKYSKKLLFIKIFHTIIWAIFVFMICYIIYTGICNMINIFTYVFIIAVAIEGIILLIFKWKCPMTIIAHRYTDDQEINFDIFLPKVIAKYNKIIFSILYIIGILIVIYRMLQ